MTGHVQGRCGLPSMLSYTMRAKELPGKESGKTAMDRATTSAAPSLASTIAQRPTKTPGLRKTLGSRRPTLGARKDTCRASAEKDNGTVATCNAVLAPGGKSHVLGVHCLLRQAHGVEGVEKRRLFLTDPRHRGSEINSVLLGHVFDGVVPLHLGAVAGDHFLEGMSISWTYDPLKFGMHGD
jgi:hypothetical protein